MSTTTITLCLFTSNEKDDIHAGSCTHSDPSGSQTVTFYTKP